MQDDRGCPGISRRAVLKGIAVGAAAAALSRLDGSPAAAADEGSDIFRVNGIPADPFTGGGNRHAGFDALLDLMAASGLFFHRSASGGSTAGPGGMIAAGDVVLVKVNAQWKHRGATNTDLVRGIVQAVLDHPDGFAGEVVIVENGQGRGSLACDTARAYDGDTSVHANANDPAHSFAWLVKTRFADPRVSKFLLDPIRERFLRSGDHRTNGYRRWGSVSFPCFTTRGGNRVELRRGVWRDGAHHPNLKLINVPVLKTHGGCELTGALKHCYGLVSMKDGRVGARHYSGLGRTCAEMYAGVRAPVLNVIDAIWVSHKELSGYPPAATARVDRIMASQDPVALDYLAAKEILYPIDSNPKHHPSAPSVWNWLTKARDGINELGGLADPDAGILQGAVTLDEARMRVHETSL